MQSAPAPANIAEALSMLDAALDHLNAVDWGSLPTPVQREALTGVTRVTKPAARDAAGWVRRLDRHPRIAAVLAAGESHSWPRGSGALPVIGALFLCAIAAWHTHVTLTECQIQSDHAVDGLCSGHWLASAWRHWLAAW